MAFDDVRLDVLQTYGNFAGGPQFRTEVYEQQGGGEVRTSRWSQARHVWNIGYAVKTLADLNGIKSFFMARKGRFNTWRLKDHFDFTSSSDGVTAGTTIDQLIATGDGSTDTYQLVKKYTSGGVTHTRPITLPVQGTLKFAENAVEKVEGVDYIVDYLTGEITRAAGNLPGGTALTWGGEFDVKVRFDTDSLETAYQDFDSGSVVDIPVIEVIDEIALPSVFFPGGGVDKVFTEDITLSRVEASDFFLDTDGEAGLTVNMPTPSAGWPLGEYFLIVNEGSDSFDIDDHNGTLITALAAGQAVDIHLFQDGGGSYWWGAL